MWKPNIHYVYQTTNHLVLVVSEGKMVKSFSHSEPWWVFFFVEVVKDPIKTSLLQRKISVGPVVSEMIKM